MNRRTIPRRPKDFSNTDLTSGAATLTVSPPWPSAATETSAEAHLPLNPPSEYPFGCETRVVWRRVILVVSAGLVLGALAICVWDYSINGGGGYNVDFFGLLIMVTALLTLGAAVTVVRAWAAAEVKVLAPALLSILAAASILFLALAINLRG